jgi:hypothetical protein
VRPFDDDIDVDDARDEAVIAGEVVTTDDAALVEVVQNLRGMARISAPEPSAALAELIAHGVTADPFEGSDPRSAPVIELAPRRRRAVRYVAGGVVAAALALGGSAAAAAVQDGVPAAQLPAAVTERVGAIVAGALEAVGVRHRAQGPSDQAVTDPGRSGEGPGASQDAPGRSGEGPGASQDAPGRYGEAPGTSQQPGEGPGASQDAPGQSGQGPGASQDAPGQSGQGPGVSQDAPGQSGQVPGTSGRAPGQGAGESDLAPGVQDRGAAPSPGDKGTEPGQSKG